MHEVATFFGVKKNDIFCFQGLKWSPSKRNGRFKSNVSMSTWDEPTMVAAYNRLKMVETVSLEHFVKTIKPIKHKFLNC